MTNQNLKPDHEYAMVFENSNSRINYQNLGFLIYHLDFSIILVCIGISLVPFDSLGTQLSFDVL